MDEILEAQLLALRSQIDSILMFIQFRREVGSAQEPVIPDVELETDEEEFLRPPVFGRGNE